MAAALGDQVYFTVLPASESRRRNEAVVEEQSWWWCLVDRWPLLVALLLVVVVVVVVAVLFLVVVVVVVFGGRHDADDAQLLQPLELADQLDQAGLVPFIVVVAGLAAPPLV
jgi:heme/copper-type cytochrome/quinol oxidase subunit 2